MLSKVAAIVAVGIVTSSMGLTANAATPTFTDIGTSYAQHDIQTLVADQILAGDGHGHFRPFDSITREDFAVVLAKILKLTPDTSASMKFTDVDSYARPYVGALVKNNLTSGISATQFGAKNPIKREDLAVFFLRAFNEADFANGINMYSSFDDTSQIDTYAKPAVEFAQKIGIMNGSPSTNGAVSFGPKQNAQRQAVADLAYEFYLDSTKYKSAINQMQQVYDLITNSKKAMNDLSSYRITEHQSIKDPNGSQNYDGTTDFIRSPYATHNKGTLSVIDSQGNVKSTQPNEEYYTPTLEYWLNQTTNQWNYIQTVGGNPDFNDLYLFDAKAFTPYLTVEDLGNTYQLSGTLNGAQLATAYPDTDETVVKYLQFENIKIMIDKSTNRVVSASVSNQLDFPPEFMSLGAWTVQAATTVDTFDNYNNEQPIQVPQDVVSTATKG